MPLNEETKQNKTWTVFISTDYLHKDGFGIK